MVQGGVDAHSGEALAPWRACCELTSQNVGIDVLIGRAVLHRRGGQVVRGGPWRALHPHRPRKARAMVGMARPSRERAAGAVGWK